MENGLKPFSLSVEFQAVAKLADKRSVALISSFFFIVP